MAVLAIKGHPERGKEVIKILEMMGGINKLALNGTQIDSYYYIDNIDSKIHLGFSIYPYDYTIYTLEEFLEKFPYKIGDKVLYKIYGIYSKIKSMLWNVEKEQVFYRLDSNKLFVATADELKPCKEETMEEDKKAKKYCTEESEDSGKNQKIAWFTFWDNDFADEVELYLKDRELVQKDGKWFVVKKKKKYPKTYEECCKIKHSDPNFYIDTHLYSDKLDSLYKLLICRDAYWKIAGEQMGLDGSWEPDYITEDNQLVYIITTQRGYLSKNTSRHWNYILAFPTEEMRDAFYENFKDLIENCKELL